MRKARHPLNHSAVSAADDEFYRNHPEMVRNGRRIPIDANAPGAAQLRKEWMDAYARHGGTFVTDNSRGGAGEVRKARDSASRRFGRNSPTSPATSCRYAGNLLPVKRDVVTVPPEADPPPHQVRCRVVESNLSCSHGRKPSPGGVLMVVPNSAVGGDRIRCKGILQGGCGSHIEWTVDGLWEAVEKGASTEFLARAIAPAVRGIFSLQQVSPQIYRVSATACQGGPFSYEVRAYPPEEITFKIDTQHFFQHIYDFLRKIPIAEEDLEKWSALWFVGAIEYAGGWHEDTASYRAYYEKKWNGGFDPLVGGSIEAPVYPLEIIPPWLVEWIKAGLFVEVKLEIKAQANIVGKYWPDVSATEWPEKGISVTGQGTVAPEVKFELISKHVLEISIAGETGISVSGSAIFDEKPEARIQAGWDGIKGKASIKAAWGWIEITRAFQLVGPEPLIDHQWALE